MKRIADLIPQAVVDLVDDVKADLEKLVASGGKLSKNSIVRSLAARGYCSEKSTDVWRTLANAGTAAGYLPAIIADVTGFKPVVKSPAKKEAVAAATEDAGEPPLPPSGPSGLARTGVTTPAPVSRTPKTGLSGLNLRSVAMINLTRQDDRPVANFTTLDGEIRSVVGFDANELSKHATVVEP